MVVQISSDAMTEETTEQLISDNMGLVVHIAKSFNPPNPTEYEEYVQLGTIGLWKAIKKYDKKLGSKLTSLAWNNIRWEILRYINKKNKHKKLIREPDFLYNYESMIQQRTVNLNPPELPELLPDTLSDAEEKVIDMRNRGYTFKEIGLQIGGHNMWWSRRVFKSAIEKIQDAN